MFFNSLSSPEEIGLGLFMEGNSIGEVIERLGQEIDATDEDLEKLAKAVNAWLNELLSSSGFELEEPQYWPRMGGIVGTYKIVKAKEKTDNIE